MNKIINRIHKMDIVTKASLVYILVGFFQKGISLISGPIFTRLLSTQEYGVLSVFNSWIDVLGVVAMLSLSAGVYNNGMMDYENERDEFTFSLLILSNIATSIIGVIFYIFKDQVITVLNIPKELIAVMFVVFFFSPALSFWTARQRYEYKYKFSCIVTVLSTFLAVLSSIIIVYFEENDKVIYKIKSEKTVLLLFWIVAYLYIAYKSKFKIKIKYWKYALKFNLPLIPHYLSNYILNSMDRVMIANLVNTTAAAIYSVAYSAAFMIQIFWQSVNAAILPLIYEKIKAKKEKDIQSKVFPFICLYGILCVFVSCVAPELFLILAPPSYYEGIYLVPILSIGVFFTGVYCLFANVEFYYKSTKAVAINSILAAIFNIVLNYIFIKKIGYTAAAYTTSICYIFQTILHYINYRKVPVKIYNEKKLLSLISFVVIACMVCIPLYSNTIVRYSVICIIVVLAIFFRNKLINLYKSIKG